jgi:Rrf2 family protein
MAVHVLAVLAYKRGQCVSSGVLASSVNTNPVMVRRLLLALQSAGLVETRKGPGLGSRLGRAAERINLAEVYRAVEMEEPVCFPRGLPNHACPVGQGIREVLQRLCQQVCLAAQRELEQMTIARVLEGIGTVPQAGKSRGGCPGPAGTKNLKTSPNGRAKK